MAKRKVEDIVYELAKPIIDRNNFELVEIEYKKEGPYWYLRVYIDKEGGITIDDCQSVSEELSDLLDIADPIEQSYIFEVSSPGLDRPLKTDRDYRKNIGKPIEIKLFYPLEGKKIIEGILKGHTESSVEIEVEGKALNVEKASIALIRPLIKF
ncbi:MAG TPA: ribosome maturation factor RimP [Bacillota bacterium]|nr:ribosome maturation factor RimP [Bacillota bacterium]HQA65137.1 ribosome maturation factor RimP [Bacillota bacterium]